MAKSSPAPGQRPPSPAPPIQRRQPTVEYGQAIVQAAPVLDLTDFKRDLSELTDRLGNAQDCL
jgi:hypothetical protein